MSTRYEIEYNICPHCNRKDTRVIGYVHVLRAYDESDLDSELVLKSWADWKKFLKDECKRGGRIIAWSGGHWEVDLDKFIEDVEKYNPQTPEIRDAKSFRDSEGYILSWRQYC